MNIYKKSELIRKAGELLCEDFKNNKNFHFTNTSYGSRGDVCGTIESKNYKNNSEHLIQYSITHKNWNDNFVSLERYTEDTYYKTPTREYKKEENTQVIQKLFFVREDYGREVYTDDEQYSKESMKKHRSRYRTTEKDKYDFFRNRELKPHTPIYDKMFTFICNKTNRPLKYGTRIDMLVYNRTDSCRYDKDWNRIPTVEIESYVSYQYRGRGYSIRREKVVYDK